MARPDTTPVDADLLDAADDLAGFAWIPGVDLILAGIRETAEAAACGELSLDDTQTLLSVIANPHNADVTGLLALLVRSVTNPVTNPALNDLAPATAKAVQHLGEIHAFETAELAPREHTNEAAALIDRI